MRSKPARNQCPNIGSTIIFIGPAVHECSGMLNVDLLPHCAKVKHDGEKDKVCGKMPMVY